MNATTLQLHQQRVTQELLRNSGTVRFIKIQTFGSLSLSESQSRLLTTLGWDIINHGIEAETLETEILMMAVMAVNHVAKHVKVNKSVLDRKNELQTVLIQRDDVSRSQGEREYSKTIELRHRIWTTHIPHSVLSKVLK